MCGIVGYVGKKISIQKSLIDNLKALEYRGYDSSGIAYVLDNKVNIVKKAGRISNLEENIKEDIVSNLGIAHTRWATHGDATDINSHPHKVGKVTIVHNGIIENYLELKSKLIKEGYTFQSATDTEVACALLDYLKKQNNNNNLEVIKEFQTYIEGSYALGIIFDDDLETLYATKNDSPLIIGLGKEENLIASDVSAITNFTKKYVIIDNKEIIKLSKDKVLFYNNKLQEITKDISEVNWNIDNQDKCGYDHYMLKEINEEPLVFRNTLNDFLNVDDFLTKMPNLNKYNKIHIVACGSAMHAGLIGKYIMENDANIEVLVEVASEYRYKKVFYDEKTLVILISQSGETADTIASLRKAKADGIDTLGIVNVVSSTIAREVDHILYIKAGVEVAVATTKAYLLQVLMLILLNLKLQYDRDLITKDKLQELLLDLKKTPNYLQELITDEKKYSAIAKKIYQDEDIFFIGRGIDYAIGMEGSLKLKEISYIHSEAYQAGELKHGTISLISDKTKVIAIITDKDIYLKTISNIKEVKARGAYVILITIDDLINDFEFANEIIKVKDINKYINPLLAIIPLQLISYEVAKLRNCDIDKPRNLAKSVTVE